MYVDEDDWNRLRSRLVLRGSNLSVWLRANVKQVLYTGATVATKTDEE